MFATHVARAQTNPVASAISKLAPRRSALVARPFAGGEVEQAPLVRPPESAISPESTRTRDPAHGIAWDFGKISVFAPDRADRPRESFSRPGIMQSKLVIG